MLSFVSGIKTPEVPIALILSILIALVIVYIYKQPRNLPPGPFSLPVIGYLWQINRMVNHPEELMSLSERYGNVMSLRLGSDLVVFLSSYEAIHEAFIKRSNVTSARYLPIRRIGRKVLVGGIINNDGASWKALRRFTLSTLRDFGYGRNLIEEKILEEVQYVQEIFEKAKDGLYSDVKGLFDFATSNIINSLVYGRRFDYDHKPFQEAIEALNVILSQVKIFNCRLFFGKIPTLLFQPGMYRLMGYRNILREFVQSQIDDHKSDFDATNIRDYVDTYIKLVSEGREHIGFNEEEFFSSILDLFAAGSGTTTAALSWALLYMTAFPEVQARCQKEIDEVTEGNRRVKLQDRKQLSYVEATLLEIQRCSSTVPLGFRHRTTEATTIGGYHIPKDTLLFPCIFAAHMDKHAFDEPRMFRPERFLNANGDVINHDLVVPFSLGPRACLGEGLAKSELFLFFTNFLNVFTFSNPAGAILDAAYQFISIRTPRPFTIKITARHI